MIFPEDLDLELRALLGARYSRAPHAIAQHARGEAHHPDGPPDAVAFPVSTQEVSAIVAACHRRQIPVVPFGAGTSLEGNALSLKGGVCVDLSGMKRVVRVSVEDLDCAVEAGVTRLELEAALKHTGLFFPVDPGADATLGGMAATRASGTTTVRYGSMRDLVRGLTVVLADGRIVRTGGRAPKSAAGYDLTGLFVGSEGTLGIITELTLRLFGRPEAATVARCAFPDVGAAVRAVTEIIQSGIPVARAELADRAQIAAIVRHSGLELPIADTLFIECQGPAGTISEQLRMIEAVAEAHGVLAIETATQPEDRSRLWKARHEALRATTLLRPGSKALVTDVCVPIGNLGECILRTQALVSAQSLPATIVGHVGDGNFHVIFPIDPASRDELEAVEALSGRIVEIALELEGTCTGEHGVGCGKLGYMQLEHGESLAVMRRIKQALDPRGILNPGKVIPADVH